MCSRTVYTNTHTGAAVHDSLSQSVTHASISNMTMEEKLIRTACHTQSNEYIHSLAYTHMELLTEMKNTNEKENPPTFRTRT